MIGEHLLGEAVEPAACGIPVDLLVKTRSVERLEPGAQGRKLLRRKLGDGFHDVFDAGHAASLDEGPPQRERAVMDPDLETGRSTKKV